MSQLQEPRDASLEPIQLPRHEPANSCQQRFEQALDDLIVVIDQLLSCPGYQGRPCDAVRLRRLRDLRGSLARFAARLGESAPVRADLDQRLRPTARRKRPSAPVAAGPDQLTARQWEIAQ